MAIKWKNKIKGKKIDIKLIAAGGSLAVGIFLLLVAIYGNIEASTNQIWFLAMIMNIFLSNGIWRLADYILFGLYGGWVPADEGYYEEWKLKWKNLQWKFNIIFAILLIFARWYFSLLQNGAFIGYWDTNYNYSTGYVMVFTVFLQYGICQWRLIKFMHGKLTPLMDYMKTVNEEKLKKAVELEKESIAKMTKSEQLKVELISNVSHDLKTPLTSMVGYIELLKKEELEDTARDYVEVISDKAGRLKEMIESLFSIAKASSGNVELNMETIDLNTLISQLHADMEDKIAESGLTFVEMLSKEDTKLTADNMYLYRICQNLFENALKYSAKGTRVFVKTFAESDADKANNTDFRSLEGEKEDVSVNPKEEETGGEQPESQAADNICTNNWICLEVTNTSGYAMDFDKEDIVERFARGDKARSSEGNGLGLAIVSSYASALGGIFDIGIDCDQFKAKVKFPG